MMFDLTSVTLTQRPILDLVWNLTALDVKHVPQFGILILYSFIFLIKMGKIKFSTPRNP